MGPVSTIMAAMSPDQDKYHPSLLMNTISKMITGLAMVLEGTFSRGYLRDQQLNLQ